MKLGLANNGYLDTEDSRCRGRVAKTTLFVVDALAGALAMATFDEDRIRRTLNGLIAGIVRVATLPYQ